MANREAAISDFCRAAELTRRHVVHASLSARLARCEGRVMCGARQATTFMKTLTVGLDVLHVCDYFPTSYQVLPEIQQKLEWE